MIFAFSFLVFDPNRQEAPEPILQNYVNYDPPGSAWVKGG
jgi:hypothetical protein